MKTIVYLRSTIRDEVPSPVDLENYDSVGYLKAEYEKLCSGEHRFGEFLTSEALYAAPFIDVYCSIYSAMNVYLPNRKDKASDFDDVPILARLAAC